MSVREYIGARYVPLFADPIAWDNTQSYEQLTIVTHLGNSYTSKQPVPAGINISNTTYWAPTGNYNAQVEFYRQEVAQMRQTVAQTDAALRADVAQSISDMESSVAQSISDMESSVAQSISDMESSVASSISALQQSVAQTDAALRADVAQDISDLQTSVQQTDTQLRTDVAQNIANLQASVQQTDTQLRADVNNIMSNAFSANSGAYYNSTEDKVYVSCFAAFKHEQQTVTSSDLFFLNPEVEPVLIAHPPNGTSQIVQSNIKVFHFPFSTYPSFVSPHINDTVSIELLGINTTSSEPAGTPYINISAQDIYTFPFGSDDVFIIYAQFSYTPASA